MGEGIVRVLGEDVGVFQTLHDGRILAPPRLFDPRSGRSPAELASVSVAANSALQADALSTAVFVLGPAAGARLISATAGADALLVSKDGTARRTDGFPAAT